MIEDLRRLLVSRARSPISDDSIVSADEAALWPQGTVAALLAAGVLKEIEPSTSVECDGCLERHVELVEFVQEPAGAPMRAYIACPAAGRVTVDTARMRRWLAIDPDRADERPRVSDLEVPDGRIAGVLDYSDDYRWVKLHDEEFNLSERQAAVARLLHEAHLSKKSGVAWPMIAARLGTPASSRMSQVFRDQPRWRRLIAPIKRGMYRLNLPA